MTTGGNNFATLANIGAINTTTNPETKIDPYIVARPALLPIVIIGARAVNVHPNTTGSPIPVNLPLYTCKNVATPHMKISTDTKYVVCSAVSPKPLATSIGTITAPAYIASTCCKLKINVFKTMSPFIIVCTIINNTEKPLKIKKLPIKNIIGTFFIQSFYILKYK